MSKDLKININDLTKKILPIINKVRRYLIIIFIVIFALIYGFLVFRVNSLNRLEPTDEALTEKLSATKRPKIDQADINKIQQLQDNSVEVQSLFKQARDNPFQE